MLWIPGRGLKSLSRSQVSTSAGRSPCGNHSLCSPSRGSCKDCFCSDGSEEVSDTWQQWRDQTGADEGAGADKWRLNYWQLKGESNCSGSGSPVESQLCQYRLLSRAACWSPHHSGRQPEPPGQQQQQHPQPRPAECPPGRASNRAGPGWKLQSSQLAGQFYTEENYRAVQQRQVDSSSF